MDRQPLFPGGCTTTGGYALPAHARTHTWYARDCRMAGPVSARGQQGGHRRVGEYDIRQAQARSGAGCLWPAVGVGRRSCRNALGRPPFYPHLPCGNPSVVLCGGVCRRQAGSFACSPGRDGCRGHAGGAARRGGMAHQPAWARCALLPCGCGVCVGDTRGGCLVYPSR